MILAVVAALALAVLMGRARDAVTETNRLRLAWSDGFLSCVASLIIVAAVALGVVRYVGGSPVERGVEGAAASLALAMVVAAPGLLVLMALTGRSALLVTAGAILLPLSFISMAGATLPLLIPAVMLFVAHRRRPVTHGPPRVPTAVTTANVVSLLVAAVFALFLHQDPRSYTTPTMSASTSDVVTVDESGLSLCLTVAALTAAWRLASPRK